ncbi:MAG: GntR family transcriptional regulator [Ancrocorticia sp.]
MIVLSAHSTAPPFEQIRSQIAAQIQSGVLRPGHRLPSIRQLAKDLRVAAGTVARAYSELEAAGLIESDRKRGSIVRGPSSRQRNIDELTEVVEQVVAVARKVGMEQADLMGMIANVWTRGGGARMASTEVHAKHEQDLANKTQRGE